MQRPPWKARRPVKRSLTLHLLSLFLVPPAQAQTASPSPAPGATYVSDQLEAPLRAGASNRYKVIGSVRNGAPVQVLKVDSAKGYTQIRTASGTKGWIQSDQLTATPGSQQQLTEVRQQLERLQNQHAELKQHMDSAASRPEGEGLNYPQLYEEALRLRQQLAQYRKVAADTVALDERNRVLQERVVTLERELQVVQQENQALRDDHDNIRFLISVLLLGAALLAAVLTPKIREQRRAQWSRL